VTTRTKRRHGDDDHGRDEGADGRCSAAQVLLPIQQIGYGGVAPESTTAGDLEIEIRRTAELGDTARAEVVRLCIDAHQEPDFEHLFSYLPPEELHMLARSGHELVGHAVVTIDGFSPRAFRSCARPTWTPWQPRPRLRGEVWAP
jgi:hypothetical protein